MMDDERDVPGEYWGAVRALRTLEVAYGLVDMPPRGLTREQARDWQGIKDRMRAMLRVLGDREGALLVEVMALPRRVAASVEEERSRYEVECAGRNRVVPPVAYPPPYKKPARGAPPTQPDPRPGSEPEPIH